MTGGSRIGKPGVRAVLHDGEGRRIGVDANVVYRFVSGSDNGCDHDVVWGLGNELCSGCGCVLVWL